MFLNEVNSLKHEKTTDSPNSSTQQRTISSDKRASRNLMENMRLYPPGPRPAPDKVTICKFTLLFKFTPIYRRSWSTGAWTVTKWSRAAGTRRSDPAGKSTRWRWKPSMHEHWPLDLSQRNTPVVESILVPLLEQSHCWQLEP